MPMWTFSSSSLPCLEKCVAAAPPEPDNKWFQKFGKKETPVETDTKVKLEDSKKAAVVVKEASSNYEDFFDTIQSETNFPVEYVIQECNKNPELTTKLAENISTNSVEQLFKSIFSDKYEETYLCTFLIKFMPMYIKLNSSRICLDAMLGMHENFPAIFKKLLQLLLNDTEIPNQVLINYTTMLNEQLSTDFMITLSHIEISSDGFSHNILAIYTAYKDSIKNEIVQNFIHNLLIQHSKSCAADRNFGRLLLTFLQSEKTTGRNQFQGIEECLDVHRSPFKRPCLVLLKEIKPS